jgi:hypothetical protein
MISLNKHDIHALMWAVARAAEWRGAEVGNPDPEPLQRFDSALRSARAALRKVREQNKRVQT